MNPDRARDSLGRPLPAGTDPGLVVPAVPDDCAGTDEQAWLTAMAYLDRGMPFHAHEVFELRWRIAPEADREAWRALAQWGAALTHQARGNPVGARRLAERARRGLSTAPHVPSIIDVGLVADSCTRLEA